MTLASQKSGLRKLVFNTKRRDNLHIYRPLQPPPVDPVGSPSDPRLVARLTPAICLKNGILPWRFVGGVTVILCSDVAIDPALATMLSKTFGPYRLSVIGAMSLKKCLLALTGAGLVAGAETLSPVEHSCRNWGFRRAQVAFASVGLGLVAGAILFPVELTLILVAAACLTLLANTLLKCAAIVLSMRRRRSEPQPCAPLSMLHMPTVTLMVPLYHEKEVARHIIRRLDALEYPRDKLDVCLIVEDDDKLTRAALESAALPDWAQVIEVPEGGIRTKPRALNYAMTFARGSIIGIYDAEDVPDPQQLRKVVERFAQRPSEVACLQGALDYYNSDANWMARCFTMEYASWFRMILPALQDLNLVIPLGGTTLFLRRPAIEDVGGWDAHNVTEDADLGLRLARAGYRTEIVETTTLEEANARPWPWIKQRSRWLKGYAMTYAVHMRQPLRLLRDLGLWRFFGVQMLFFGTLLSFVLAPLLWSFWLIPLGLPHPVQSAVSPATFTAMICLFIGSELISMVLTFLAVRRTGRKWLGLWAPTLMAYFPLATLAVYKGLSEMMTKPFYWDKTEHGVHAPMLAIPQPQPAERQFAAE